MQAQAVVKALLLTRASPGAENLLDHHARLAHGRDGRGRQRDGLTVPGDRDDLRNSQVTSIQHDRH